MRFIFRHESGAVQPVEAPDAVEARNLLNVIRSCDGLNPAQWSIDTTPKVERAVNIRAETKETRG